MNHADFCNLLLNDRHPHDALATPGCPSIYAVFLQPRGLLLPITPGINGLLFIGATQDGFAARDHFLAPDSSTSDLRRTLGAVLRNHLGLHVGVAGDPPNTENYRFIQDGEIILSRWMRANLLASTIPAEGDLAQLEAQLIAEHQPPLNLAGWDNPQAAILQKFRGVCVNHAARASKAAA
ncbi:MAG TPA: hypothetical protein VIA80_13830 [Hyphomonadaceae bacterium]|jgi:hypothetical protein